MRVVVDTNVIVSALLGSPNAQAILVAFRDGHLQLVTTRELVDEMGRVLTRPKLATVVDAGEAKRVRRLVLRRASIVTATSNVSICGDPKDNVILAAAIAGRAAAVVTGDNDLLVLHPYEGIDIIKPADFLARLNKRDGVR
ncbi:MAG: putative toxin-antitoxin system toxin component, PIN family [Deltaproteobacteria bacterium]|nr:putative toxin-antitoxin system toxin component, PIN family [Deltaproteobacteria bacterium]